MIKIQNSKYTFLLALILGVVSAVALSVWATSIGTNIDVTGRLDVQSTTATSTFASGHGFNFGSGQFVIQQTSGNVGIGTTSPKNALEIRNNSDNATLWVHYAGIGNPRMTLEANSSRGGRKYTLYSTIDDNSVSGGKLVFEDETAFDEGSNVFQSSRVVLNKIGYVGIGAFNPIATLDVGGFFTVSATSSKVGIGTTSPYALLSVEANTTATDLFAVGDQGTSSPLFVVKGSGNVGIGTSSPASNATQSLDSTATTTLYISSTIGNKGGCIQFEGPASTTFRLYATTTGPAIFEQGACQ